MRKLNLRLIRTGGGIFHDSRADARLLGDQLNKVAAKCDEIIDELEKTKKELYDLKSVLTSNHTVNN